MAPKEDNFTIGGPTLGDHVNKDQSAASANIQDHILLKALQDLIVRVIDPTQKNDTNAVHLGPEARKLITALQEFISSIVTRSQPETQHALDINLDEEQDKIQEADPDDDGDVGPLPRVSSSESEGGATLSNNLSGPDTFEKPRLIFEEKLLKALREHVFNTMPIRLLCFESRESSFQTVLLERGAIYARLAPVFQHRIHEEEFQPQKKQYGGTETDEEMIKRLISKYARYAILSHTWLRTTPGEVTYGDWNKGLFDAQSPGYRKLANFCKVAQRDHGLAFGWMDTICINKESSSELDESIRSMYNWYSRAAVSLVFLAETGTLSNMHIDPWFTRGWTLQELLAPDVIKFYDDHWKQLADHSANDKNDAHILKQIKQATTISEQELRTIRWVPISRRMQMAATREVTREEDMAYSLMGIFDISISTAYGEGAQRAFFRLLQEILVTATENALDVLNWAGELPYGRSYLSQVLPSSPEYYIRRSSDKSLLITWPTEPLTLTHLGLRVPVILMPGMSIQDTLSSHGPIGDYNAIVNISPVGSYGRRNYPTTYNLLDSRVSGSDGLNEDNDWVQMTFAVFNFNRDQNAIYLPKTCIAIGLNCSEVAGKVSSAVGSTERIETLEPIVFKLAENATVNQQVSPYAYNTDFWKVKSNKLAKHGMQLISLYL